jgi:hypothetical protein
MCLIVIMFICFVDRLQQTVVYDNKNTGKLRNSVCSELENVCLNFSENHQAVYELQMSGSY